MSNLAKKIALTALALILAAAAAGCGAGKTAGPAPAKLKVVVSVYPVYEFARQVGGDKVDLVQLVPPGAEPHDWEPTAKEIVAIKSAKLFLYHGAGFENLGKILTKDTLEATRAIEVSQGIPVIEQHDAGHGHHHHVDAHMWLDPVNARRQVDNIAAALAAADPQNAAYYRDNAARYGQELAKLDQEYKIALAQLPRREIVTSHAAFGYLTSRYGLTQLSIMGLTPDSEPTPERMSSIVEFCRQHHVKYIFFETIVSPKLAQTIARETGAGLLVLHPVESLTDTEIKQGKNYLVIMRENLANLQKALGE